MTVVQPRLVLVVDDDEPTCNLLRDFCETSGFRVNTAQTGDEAIEQIVRERPDLVLLDLMIPGKDGFAVLQTIRRTPAWSELPVIILTAMGEMDGKIRGMELGADDYVTKPFKLVDLQTRVNSALLVRDYRRRLQAAEEELAQLRAVDPITGAGTYSQLKASLDAEVSRATRYGRPLAVLMFGLDDYQYIRAQLGRERCDEFIAKLASVIRTSLRGADRLFRVDTDEFVALLPETDGSGSRVVAQRLGAVVRELSIEGRSAKIIATIRVGGVALPRDGIHKGEDLLREANRSFCAVREAVPEKFIFDL